MKHEPTPWHFNPDFNYEGNAVIQAKDNFHIATVNKFAESFGDGKHKANAAFIVKAVNNHEKLVEKLKALVNMIEFDAKQNDTNLGEIVLEEPVFTEAQALLEEIENDN
jgi:hypothetical protein